MFSRATQTWFDEAFESPTEVQRRGWDVIRSGRHALLVAPTGSGKTLAAFLAGIDALGALPPDAEPGVRVLYISPLKALVYDVERNLRVPLAGIRRTSERLGLPAPDVTVSVRTGDTPQRERQQQAKHPGRIVVTTPESLFLLLGSRARANFRTVDTVILDEVHALAPTKRGSHLSLSLERLAEIAERDPQRIGLSATVRPLDEIAAWVGGDREVEVVDASRPPMLDLKVVVPVADMSRPPDPSLDGSADGAGPGRRRRGGSILGELRISESMTSTPSSERGLWPSLYPALSAEIDGGRSTILFTNSRGLCERLAQRLNDGEDEDRVRAHHGSVSHEKRAEIEEGLKTGTLRGIVATSSLELGIDMGAVDRVLLVESPGSVARGLQRVGRAGHGVGQTSIGRIYPKSRGDLLECAVLAERMLRAELEAVAVPRNALDVLAQQIVAMCCDKERGVEEIASLVRRAHPYRDLGRASLEATLDMLSGRYPSEDFADLRPLLAWDRARDVLSARRGAPMVTRMSGGTIPDRGTFGVHLTDGGPRVGELDEEMVHETRVGDPILLGASTWRVEEITRDRVLVTPAPGEPGRLPFWKGEGPGRPIEVGRALGAYLRELADVPRPEAEAWIRARAPLDELAARNLADYVFEQRAHAGTLPTDRAVCVERFRDELGDWRVCVLTPFGARVHAPWAMALQRTLSSRSGFETQAVWSDDGIVLRFADADEPPAVETLFPAPEELEDLVTEQLADSALFAGLFRENAVRSLLLPKRRPGQRNPLWAQRLKSQQLLAVVRRYPTFPIVLETYRQAMRDVFDLPALTELLRDVQDRRITVHETETASASPFARSLVFSYVAAYMYEQDSPLAERRAQALTVDPAMLRELLGAPELRELIDPEVLARLESELQRLPEDRRARDADELHDLLRGLGDLTPDEIDARAAGEAADAAEWRDRLERERRAVPVKVAGERRWIAAEDAGLYRDALGVSPPSGLPEAFLAPVEQPLHRLVRRWARRHGPFQAEDVAGRWNLRPAQVEAILRELAADGLLVRGEIRPGGVHRDWCDAEVLRRLKRETLASLRRDVSPVDGRTLGNFLPRWHGIGERAAGNDRLLDVVAQLEGVALPWSELRDAVLPARVAGFRVDQLDALSTAGAVAWIGRGALGARDGRVSLHLRENVSVWIDPPAADEEPASALHAAILSILEARGAQFAPAIEREARDRDPGATAAEFRAALLDLAWSGRVTNDTFAALDLSAAVARGGARARGPRAMRRGALASGGRWSRVEDLLGVPPDPTERALARARTMLDRWGVVSRDVAAVESLPGGFGSIYRVLRGLEDAGRIRRGWFVEGMAGAQFAHAAAVDRLRSARPPDDAPPLTADDVQVLPAVDPANPWGAVLPWPLPDEDDAAPPRRVAGAWVLLAAGWPIAWLGPRGRAIRVFPPPGSSAEEVVPLVVESLRRLPERARRSLRIERIDGRPYRESPLLGGFRDSGFSAGYRGLADTRV
jgi:ATP-dependent Lhr-like helicase